MAIRLYLDDDSAATALLVELRRLGFDVVSTDEAGNRGAADRLHLLYASAERRALVTANQSDFVPLHYEWLRESMHHSGIIVARQDIPLGERIRRLAEICELGEPGDLDDRLLMLTQWA